MVLLYFDVCPGPDRLDQQWVGRREDHSQRPGGGLLRWTSAPEVIWWEICGAFDSPCTSLKTGSNSYEFLYPDSIAPILVDKSLWKRYYSFSQCKTDSGQQLNTRFYFPTPTTHLQIHQHYSITLKCSFLAALLLCPISPVINVFVTCVL